MGPGAMEFRARQVILRSKRRVRESRFPRSPTGAELLVGVCATWLAVACSAASPTESGMTGNRDAAADSSQGDKCSPLPISLVDYTPDVPEGGRSAVQVPTIRVNDNGLFYVLNWQTPIGSSEGPGGYVMRIPLRGGMPTRLASVAGGGSQGGQGLAVTRSAAIFSQAHGDDAGAGAIVTVPAEGGEPTIIALTTGLANALVADDANVYFVDGEGTKSVPLGGGTVRTLATERPYSLGLSGRTLYLADLDTGAISSVSIEGGPITVLTSDPGGALYPRACGEALCWVSGPALDAALKQLVPGGTPTVLATGFRQLHDFVFDGKYFFLSTEHLLLQRVPRDGGAPLVIQSQGLITSLDLDDACLYWSSARGIFSWALSAADQPPSLEM
jgi:hypothetical protein